MSAKMMEQQIAALQQRVEKLEAKTIAATRRQLAWCCWHTQS